MSATSYDSKLGDLIVKNPDLSDLFEHLGIDYCCGGSRTLREACEEVGLEPATAAALIAALEQGGGAGVAESRSHDVSGASISGLCDHIVTEHHEPLREDLNRISELLATVVRVHGRDRPDLADLQRLFTSTQSELEEHMRTEEESLFPACRAVEDSPRTAQVDRTLIEHLEDDHAETGQALAALRELAGGYESEQALCGTHRRLLASLDDFEREMHQHVHEENNILFPRVRSQLDAIPA